MNKDFLETLLNWPQTYISGTDLCFLLLGKSSNSRYAIIKRAVKEGYLISLRRDLYLIKHHRKHSNTDLFSLSTIIYGPSYVSFESALSYHGWIPEAVKTLTCATIKKSKEFETPIGLFSYQHVSAKAFPIGIECRLQNEVTFYMASPWKALADMIYVRKRHWKTLQDLFDDLRIEQETLENAGQALLVALIDHYPNFRVRKTLQDLQKELSRS